MYLFRSMIEITKVINMTPAVVVYKEDDEEKSTLVYIDYLSKNIIPTEDINSIDEFKNLVFNHIGKQRKPVAIPEIPKNNFTNGPGSFDNF